MLTHVRNRVQASGDCGVATMACIAQISYDDALDLAVKHGTVKRVGNKTARSRRLTIKSMRAMVEGHFGVAWAMFNPGDSFPLVQDFRDDPRLEKAVLLISEGGTHYGHWIACHDHVIYDSNFIVPRPIAIYSRDGWLLERIISPPAFSFAEE
jgi:hypothetical protein